MGKNYNGTQISQSVTVSEVAGATIEDCRNKIFVYDENGKAILATGGTKPFIGVALIEAGINDMFGEVSGKVEAGDDIDIQIKDIAMKLQLGQTELPQRQKPGTMSLVLHLAKLPKTDMPECRSANIRKMRKQEVRKNG